MISTEDVGRPAENIEHYTRAHALYLTDLARWRLSVAAAAGLLLDAGMSPYLLLPDGPELQRILVRELARLRRRARRRRRRRSRRPEWFVVSHYHRGIPLKVYRVGGAPGAGRQ